MKIIEESSKIYFNVGDTVFFKGIPESEQPTMRVSKIVFEKDINNEVIKINGKKIISGVQVLFFPEFKLGEDKTVKGEPIEKIVDSRSIYKKEYKVNYYLNEAKKILVSENKLELVEMINNIINKI